MNFNDIDDLKNNGFEGFQSVRQLWLDKSCIPKVKGIYLVINPNFKSVKYIQPGVGGFFIGKDPNISIEALKKNHVPDSMIVYIGKAGSNTGKATLYSRLSQYLRFGQTKNVGHWGGRLIWQLKNHQDLILCWKQTPSQDPRELEKKLIKKYCDVFGQRPFANLTG